MITPAFKEAFFFYLGIVTALLIAAGSTVALVFMGFGLMRKISG